MKLENVVPWGRNLGEYKDMFLLRGDDLQSKILGCGDGPSSFNYEVTVQGGDVISIDPLYQFKKEEIEKRINETSQIVSEQLQQKRDDFVWKTIQSVDELIKIRLDAMRDFINDYPDRRRYLYQELPKLSFEDNSFDLVLSSHFLFLYSEHFDFTFHVDSIVEMCRVAQKEVRIFPIVDLKNSKSPYVEPILKIVHDRGYKAEIVKTDYEFQKGAFEMLRIVL